MVKVDIEAINSCHNSIVDIKVTVRKTRAQVADPEEPFFSHTQIAADTCYIET